MKEPVIFLKRIQELRAKAGLTQKQLANKLGLSEPMVSLYESGQRNVSCRSLLIMAEVFNTSADYILELTNNPAPQERSRISGELLLLLEDAAEEDLDAISGFLRVSKARKVVPLRQTRLVPCYNSAAGVGDPEPDEQPEKIETDDPRAEWAVHISGNSMEPLLPDGSVAFGMNRKPQDGEVGAFRVDGMFTVKQVCVDSEGNTYLFATNRDRSDADQTIRYNSGRDLWCYGTILCDKVPLPD